MGRTIIVTGTITVAWDADELRKQWEEPDLTDEELLEQCKFSVEQDWDQYATTPDTLDIFAELA